MEAKVSVSHRDRQLEKWERFFEQGFAPWDSGAPASQLVSLMDSLALQRGHVVKRAVELGCGTGATTRWLATRLDVAVGVDIVPAAIAQAREAATATRSTATFVVADILDLPVDLTANPFDFVFDCQCFHCT